MKKLTALVLSLALLACIGLAAAEEADLNAMFQEARQASMNGDAAKANGLFEQLYTLGDARGAEMLATAYQNGDGVEQDYTKAMEWNFRAVNMGSGRFRDSFRIEVRAEHKGCLDRRAEHFDRNGTLILH